MRLLAIAVFLLFIVTECRAKLVDYVSELPPCGLQCLLKLIPESECNIFTNNSCICTNDVLYNNFETCVSANCTGVESLAVLRARADGCGDPVRSRKTELWAVLAIEIFAILCSGIRLFSRWQMKIWWIDDYIMLLVVAIFIPFTVISAYDRITAYGVDVWTVAPDDLTEALRLFYVEEALYLMIISVTKIMVLCFYYRIFPPRPFRLCCIATMIFVGLSGVSCLMAQLLQCLPIRYNWDGWKKEEDFGDVKCVDINALITACACLAIAQDIIIVVLPLPVLANLKASWKKRAGIILMFSLGTFVTITSCLRLSYIVKFSTTTNPTWDNTDALVWTTFEVNVAVICACLPAIRAYLGKLLPRVFGTTAASTATGASGMQRNNKPSNSSRSYPKASQTFEMSITKPSPKSNDESDSESQIAFRFPRDELSV